MANKLTNLEYIAIKEQTSPTVGVTPDIYIKGQSMTLEGEENFDEDTRVCGNKTARQELLQGLRTNQGTIDVFAEPNASYDYFSMLYARGATTGSDPYTTVFDPTSSTVPTYYTVDIAKNDLVYRYIGVQASQITPKYDSNKAHFDIDIKALNSFTAAPVASVSGSTLTLKTTWDPIPNAGLTTDDTLRWYDVSGDTYTDLTVTAVDANGVEVTVSEDVSAAVADDIIVLKPVASPSWLTEMTPFMWGRKEVKEAPAVAGIAAATVSNIEQDSNCVWIHSIENDTGDTMAGTLHASELRRLTSDAELNIKRIHEGTSQENKLKTLEKQAVQYKWYSGNVSTHYLNSIFSSVQQRNAPKSWTSGELQYTEEEYAVGWNSTTSDNMVITLVNSRDTT